MPLPSRSSSSTQAREALRLAILPAVILLAAALAGCGESSTAPAASSTATTDVGTSAIISEDVARDAGDATATLQETFTGSEVASGASASVADRGIGLAFSTAPSASLATTCTGPDAAGFYTCGKVQENGFTIARSWRYWAGGSVAVRYAEASTDSVNHRWSVTGTHTTADTGSAVTTRSVAVHRADTSSMQVVRGATPAHVWNGTGVRVDTTSATDGKGTRTYTVTAFDTTQGVTYAMPRRTNVWPTSGTVTHDVRTVWTSAKGATVTTTRRAVVTFNGTRTASVQVGALTCSLDLKTHAASGCK